MGNNPQHFRNSVGSALQVIDETAKEPNRALSTHGSGVAIDDDQEHLSPTGLLESPHG